MMRRLGLCLALLSLAGCGPRYIWVKDVSQDELNRDRYECERDMRAGALSFGGGIAGQINANEFMGRCFQAKGYVLQPINAPPPDQSAYRPPQDVDINYQFGTCIESCSLNSPGPACVDLCRKSYPGAK